MHQAKLDTKLFSSGGGNCCIPKVSQWVEVPRRAGTIETQNCLEVVPSYDMYVESASYAGSQSVLVQPAQNDEPRTIVGHDDLHVGFVDDLAIFPILHVAQGEGTLTVSQSGTDHFHASSS